jgi:hypothetical protein
MVIEIPAAKFKEWMVKYQYDPEHGKEVPVAPDPESPGAGTSVPK